MHGYQPKPVPGTGPVAPPPRDPDGQREAFVLEVERANAALTLAQQLLPPISEAASCEAVASALAAGRAELARLVRGGVDVSQARPLLALLELNAEERLREFPVPGTSAPLGLLAGSASQV